MQSRSAIEAKLDDMRSQLREFLIELVDVDQPDANILVDEAVIDGSQSALDELIPEPESPGLRVMLGEIQVLVAALAGRHEVDLRHDFERERGEFRTVLGYYVGTPGKGGEVTLQMAMYVADSLNDLDDIYEADDDCDVNLAYGRLGAYRWLLDA